MIKLNYLLGLICISSLFSNTLGGLIKDDEVFEIDYSDQSEDELITDGYITDEIPTEGIPTDEIPTEYVTSTVNDEHMKRNMICGKIQDILNQYAEDVFFFECEIIDERVSFELDGGSITQEAIDKLSPFNVTSIHMYDINLPKDLNMESLNLDYLELYTCPLEGDDPLNIIKSLKTVKNLSLRGYRLSQNIINEISNITNLEYLRFEAKEYDNNLNFNPLSKLTEKLEILAINGIDEFPEAFCQLKNLKKLEFIDSNVSTIPRCIKNLKKLEQLDLSNNKISKLPEEFGELSSLNILDLKKNEFVIVPKVLGNLSNLKKLVLSKNRIGRISNVICKLNNLKGLYLSYNKIKYIPTCFEKFDNLESLYVGNNELVTIPKVIAKIRSLEYLDLGNNKINDTIPESLNDIPYLYYIMLNGNVDIRGKTLTNPHLYGCYYNVKNNKTPNGLCISEKIECVDESLPMC